MASPTRFDRWSPTKQIEESPTFDPNESVAELLKRFNPGNKPHLPNDVTYNGKPIEAYTSTLMTAPLYYQEEGQWKKYTASIQQVDKQKCLVLHDGPKFDLEGSLKIKDTSKFTFGIGNDLFGTDTRKERDAFLVFMNHLSKENTLTNLMEEEQMNSLKEDIQELKQTILKQLANQETFNFDRPSRSLLVAMNDKLTQVSALSDHMQKTHFSKLCSIEDKLTRSKTHQVDSKMDEILTALKDFNFDNAPTSVNDIENNQILKKLDELRESSGQESSLMRDRMGKLIEMFSILHNSKPDESLVKSIHSLLVSYLPTDLEARLNSIESRLRSPVQSKVGTDVLCNWQIEIMNQNRTILSSLESLQHNLARICDVLPKGKTIHVLDTFQMEKVNEIQNLERKRQCLMDNIEKLELQRERLLSRIMIEKLSGDPQPIQRRVISLSK